MKILITGHRNGRNHRFSINDVHPLTPNEANPKLAGLSQLEVLSLVAWLRWRKSRAGQRGCWFIFPCWSDASNPRSEGEKGRSPLWKHSTADNPMFFSASKTSIIQPKLIVTGIYMYLPSSLSSARRFRHWRTAFIQLSKILQAEINGASQGFLLLAANVWTSPSSRFTRGNVKASLSPLNGLFVCVCV